MADQKVSDLPALNGADVDAADLLYIVDSSAGAAGSKKITIGQFQLAPLSGLSASQAVFTDGSKALVSNAITGTGNVVMSASPTLTGTVSAAAMTLSGALTANGNTTLGDAVGDVITVNGTATFANANPTLSAGTANGVLYLNGSKVATSGSALTFDGTNAATTGTASATKFIPTGGTATGNGMYLPAANTLAWSNNGSETMRLDGSNLGLGVTPSAWGGNYKTFQTPAGGIGAYSTASVAYAQNAYDSGIGAWKYLTTGVAAGLYNQTGGQHHWLIAPLGIAGDPISFTQAMTLQGGISTNLPAILNLKGYNATNGGAAYCVQKAGTTSTHAAFGDAAAIIGGAVDSTVMIWTNNDPLVFQVGSERARITSGGDLLVGTTAAGSLNGRVTVQSALGGNSSIGTLAGSGTGALDTGISINQGSSGGCIVLIASRNVSAGTNTDAAVYIVRFYYDGNNAPTTVYVGGSSNFVTFGTSGSNTLTLTNAGGGNVNYSWFGNK